MVACSMDPIEQDSLEIHMTYDTNDEEEAAADHLHNQDEQQESRLCLARSGLRSLPAQLLSSPRITLLDIRDNLLTELPADIWRLQGLQEMRLDRNALRELPPGLVRLRELHTLSAAQNRLAALPPGLLGHMPALRALSLHSNLLEAAAVSAAAQKPRVIEEESGEDDAGSLEAQERALGPLSHVDLRHNALSGSIVLADYGALTSLDVSHNSVQSLDLAALEQLRRLHCANNELRHLALSGRSLEVLVASGNRLQLVQVDPPPNKLQELDLSRNELMMVPTWLAESRALSNLDLSHNQITALPESLLHLPHLHTLQAGHNALRTLPSPGRGNVALQTVRLQSNALTSLPPGLLSACNRLVELNVSGNRLAVLLDEGAGPPLRSLRRLLVACNQLGDAALRQMARMPSLKLLHAAHNRFTKLPDACIEAWSELQELVLSGNQLTSLPDSITRLKKLQVLRLHSNQMRSCPAVSHMSTLKVLDLSHNRLEQVDLARLAPPGLQCLDVSCNNRLHVDPGHFNYYRSQRPMSLVDTTGQNRSCLPASPYHEAAACELPWALGFADSGAGSRLPTCQLRLPGFCNTEALLGVFEGRGAAGPDVAMLLARSVPRLLLEERTIPETAAEFMKYTLLSAHRELRQRGQLSGADASLCHISRASPAKPYMLRVASVGGARVLLARRGGLVARLTRAPSLGEPARSLGRSAEFPQVVPDPFVTEVVLGEADQFLLVASERFWEQVPEEEAVREVCAALGVGRGTREANVAAKRLVDLAQSYGCNGAISVLVLSLLGEGLRPSNHCVRVVSPGEAFMTHARSSPSGQSAEDDPGLEAFSSGSKQLRCWEYMLERNTRVLFDRELQANMPQNGTTQRNQLPRASSKLSNSTQGDQHRLLYSGPHAAYFGSLQRLLPSVAAVAPMPTNETPGEMLQFVPEEEAPQGSEADSTQCGSRMQRYWGVATTEL
ncbi:hypothetical protein B566_EDAN005408 [Ephemera danica]|nr:hypothetical protein B566_EDAN005408 [Ephemera danica]